MRRRKLTDMIEKKVKNKKLKNVILNVLNWEEERIDYERNQLKFRDDIKRIVELEIEK